MECKEGYIKSLDARKVVVSVERNPMCAHCKAKDSCIDSYEGTRIIDIELDRDCVPGDLKVNDRVEIEYKSSRFLADILFAYLIPAVCIILGVIAGQYITVFEGRDMNNGLFFLLGLAFGIIILVIYEKLNKKKKSFNFIIKKI